MGSLGKHLQAQGYKLLECEEKREVADGTGGSFLKSESWFGINSIISRENGKQTNQFMVGQSASRLFLLKFYGQRLVQESRRSPDARLKEEINDGNWG